MRKNAPPTTPIAGEADLVLQKTIANDVAPSFAQSVQMIVDMFALPQGKMHAWAANQNEITTLLEDEETDEDGDSKRESGRRRRGPRFRLFREGWHWRRRAPAASWKAEERPKKGGKGGPN